MRNWKKVLVTTMFILIASQSTVYAADYTVAANDSLYKISTLFKVPIDTIKSDNTLHSDSIMIGQKLSVSALVYKVKSGDTLKKVAAKYGVTVTAIKKANHKKTSTIKIGQKLIIPGIQPVSGSGAIVPYTKDEVSLLARLIEAEASGEPYQAKVAVGAVVINRVQSKDWAPSIKDVIYQKFGQYYQFTPVKNGMIDKPASSDSTRAAWEALKGTDPSRNAIYYFDNTSTNNWLWAKTRTASIGKMVFVK
jgi:spore germination cell wall hydrolase CwlJ-like protein